MASTSLSNQVSGVGPGRGSNSGGLIVEVIVGWIKSLLESGLLGREVVEWSDLSLSNFSLGDFSLSDLSLSDLSKLPIFPFPFPLQLPLETTSSSCNSNRSTNPLVL